MEMDTNEIGALLHIEEKTREYGKLFENIRNAALARLGEINEELAPEPEEESIHEPVPPDEDQGTTVEPRKEEPKPEPTKPEHLTAKENQWPETSSANSDPEAPSPNGAPRRTVVAATPKT